MTRQADTGLRTWGVLDHSHTRPTNTPSQAIWTDEDQARTLLKKHFRDMDDFFVGKVGLEQLVSVFEEDAVRTRGDVDATGIEAIKNAFLKQRDELLSMKHKVKRLVVTVKADDASATAEWTVSLRTRDGKSRRLSGYDAFALEKIGGVWKITSLLIMPQGGVLFYR